MPAIPSESLRSTDADESQPALDWDQRIAELLSDLSIVQSDLLEMLDKKRELIASRDSEGLSAIEANESELILRLQSCCDRRQQLLQSAGEAQLPCDSLQTLARSLPGEQRGRLRGDLQTARRRTRLLQHQSLTNWVLVQRTLLHLSQMIEIIATGGRMQPTYGKEPPSTSGGALVDQAV